MKVTACRDNDDYDYPRGLICAAERGEMEVLQYLGKTQNSSPLILSPFISIVLKFSLTVSGQDSCQGDSGGPLIAQAAKYSDSLNKRYSWIGIVSFGVGCAEEVTS